MKNNDIITQILNGNIGVPQNMSVPSSKGLPNNMSIPNDPRYGLVINPNNDNDELNTFVDKEVKNQDWYDPSNYEEINDGVELNNIEDNNNTDESILNSLNLPQKKEYSFENGFKSGMGIEDILGKYKDIQKGLGYEKKPINTALSEKQRSNVLFDALAAASQSIANTPRGNYSGYGFKGFLRDLGAMLVPGTMAYKASEEKALKENEAKAKAQEILNMQQEAIARAIEKELYNRETDKEDKRYKREYDKEKLDVDKEDKRYKREYDKEKLDVDKEDKRYKREYDKEKLGVERERINAIHNSDLARMRAETNQKRFELNEKKWNKENPDYSNAENNREGYDIKDMGTYVRINDVDIPKMTTQTENLVAKKKNAVADSYHEVEKIKTKIEEFEKKYGLTEETNPIYNNINRATFNLQNFVANIPYLGLDERAELIADYKDISSLVAKLDTVIEKSLGAALGVGMYDRYQRDGVAPNLKKDYGKTFLKKFDSLYKEIKETYDVLDFASVKKLNVDKKQLEKILENNKKKLKKEGTETPEENKDDTTKETVEKNNKKKTFEEKKKKYNF